MKHSFSAFILVGLFLAIQFSTAAQTSQTGFPPFGSFAEGSFDTVNLQNVNVHFSIPIVQKNGRGLPFNVALNYDSTVWSGSGTWQPIAPGGGTSGTASTLSSWGWSLAPVSSVTATGTLEYFCYSGQYPTGEAYEITFSYRDTQGTNHPFSGGLEWLTGTCGNSEPVQWEGPAYDGSGLTLLVNLDTGASVIDTHGNQTYFSVPSGQTGVFQNPIETDTNGNQTSIAMPTGSSYNDTLTDTLGTALTIAGSGTPSSPVTLTYKDPNGNPMVYTVKVTQYTVRTNFGCQYPEDYQPALQDLITEIDLPNGDKYTFTYEPTPGYAGDVTARLASVTVPTGGTISYNYSGGGGNGYGVFCTYVSSQPAITLKRYTPDTGSNFWSYSANFPGVTLPTVVSTTVTDPLSNQTVVSFYDNGANGVYENQRKTYQGSGTLLQTTYDCYNGASLPCTSFGTSGAYPFSRKTTYTLWPNGQESETNTLYQSSAPGFSNLSVGLITEQDEYDYGNGALLRKTTISYASLTENIYGFSGQTDNILDRPSQVSVYDSGSLKAQTSYTYDGGSLTASNISTQHVSMTGSRGNPTTITRQVGGSSTISTSATYFDTGMMNIGYDGKSNPTTYNYSPTYAGAYPTTITNALNQPTTNTYDINSGLLTSTKDPNNQITSYTYDNMLRMTQIGYPGGGQSTFCYTDVGGPACSQSGSPYSTVQTDKIGSSMNRVTWVQFDGLGRQSRHAVTNGEAQPYDQIDACYDAFGRVSFQSYPYQGSGWSMSKVCSGGGDTFSYDALSRTTAVTHSDGSVASINYSNFPCVTITDEQSKAKQDCSDGGGRLTSVTEDPGSSPHLNYTTAYTYDVLNNLTSVTQAGSRQRTFTYDELSRLTSSINPESNWSPTFLMLVPTTYAYDADGNLVNKTEPAQNQQSTATVTMTYCYDAGNRLTAKGYTSQTCSNGTMPSPIATYAYDGNTPVGCSVGAFNYGLPIGRRTAMCDQAGSEAWGYNIASGIGWTTTQQRTTNGVTKTSVYQADLLGSPLSVQYPSGRTISYTPNLADRPTSATDGSTGVQYGHNVHYWANGMPCWTQYGSSLTGAATFNTRQQPLEIQATNANVSYSGGCPGLGQTGNVLDLSYNFNLGMDNGNAMGITNNIDGTRSQAFTYDPLSRLLTAAASTYAVSSANCWGEAYVYDNNPNGGAWGNLTNINSAGAAYTSCRQEGFLNVAATVQNRVSNGSSYGYDTAGNMIVASPATYSFDAENHLISTAGVNYTYDGDGKRVAKSNGVIYWYGLNDEVLDESDGSGTITNEYVFLGGKRIARIAVH